MTKKSNNTSSTSNVQRTIVSVVSGVVIIIIVLIAQALGIDVLPQESGSTAIPAATTAPTLAPTKVAMGSSALLAIPGGYDGNWFQVYFTDPINSTDEADFTDAPIEEALVKALDSAQTSIDAAFFELNSQPVTDALIRAQERGVTVRVVADDEHGLEDPESTFDQLELADIEVVSDERSGLMHDKFVVIDSMYVWTGSTNITHNGMYNNNNNSMLIRSSKLAANYSAEFEEMFSQGGFGKTSDVTIANAVITVEGTQIETIFESEGNAPARLIELIKNAHSVRFMAFSFTRDDMFQPMLANPNLDIMGIVEASSRSYIEPLYCGNVNVRQDGNPDILHHKVFIFDESIVVMGSFNFSSSAADNNDENLLIIHNLDLAQAYLEEFDRRWAEAEEMPASAFDC
ncbi:MAG: hypothetical protein JXA10_07145 [Anaerolineae bacterium]|nr:hypothetical protein [Anaerolineae bacterium]